MTDDWQDVNEIVFAEQPDSNSDLGLSETGIQEMQGFSDNDRADYSSPSQKGSDFENKSRGDVFHGESRRLVVRPEDNPHLDKLGDGVGITRERRISDAYVNVDGSLWELKSGYEKGGIDQDQLYEYSLMEEAGYVNVRDGDKLEKVPVTSINYLFDSRAGAKANASDLKGMATAWYTDEDGNVQLFKA